MVNLKAQSLKELEIFKDLRSKLENVISSPSLEFPPQFPSSPRSKTMLSFSTSSANVSSHHFKLDVCTLSGNNSKFLFKFGSIHQTVLEMMRRNNKGANFYVSSQRLFDKRHERMIYKLTSFPGTLSTPF